MRLTRIFGQQGEFATLSKFPCTASRLGEMVGWQFMGRRPTSVNQLRRVWARRLERQLTNKCVLLDDLVPKIADSRHGEKVKVRQLRKDPG